MTGEVGRLRLSSPAANSLAAQRAPRSFSHQTGVAGSPPGFKSNSKKERAMAAKIRANSKEFTLSWEEFEKNFYHAKESAEDFEMNLKQAGNC